MIVTCFPLEQSNPPLRNSWITRASHCLNTEQEDAARAAAASCVPALCPGSQNPGFPQSSSDGRGRWSLLPMATGESAAGRNGRGYFSLQLSLPDDTKSCRWWWHAEGSSGSCTKPSGCFPVTPLLLLPEPHHGLSPERCLKKAAAGWNFCQAFGN